MLMDHVEAVMTIIIGTRKNKNAYQEFVIIDQESLEMDNVRLAPLSSILLKTREIASNAAVDLEKSARMMVHALAAQTSRLLELLENPWLLVVFRQLVIMQFYKQMDLVFHVGLVKNSMMKRLNV
jgi:hypothetical protein